jgi:hypothetical protein
MPTTTKITDTHNRVSVLNFSGPMVHAALVQDVRDPLIEGRAIVINPGVSAVAVGRSPRRWIPALSSTILCDTQIERARSLIVLRAPEQAPAGIVAQPGWRLLGELLGDGSFPVGVPLWKSPQDEAGSIAFAPPVVLRQTAAGAERLFRIRANLWFAPAGTDCLIHNLHDFVEVHTQVSGYGRMQKFRDQDYSTLYEDLLMSPGYTTPEPFCTSRPDGSFAYPWHQYHADTDCVWLAIEYHAETERPHRGRGTTDQPTR